MKDKIKKIEIILICVGLFSVVIYTAIRENFFMRAYREFEYKFTDQISIADGYYVGDVDLGILEGKGTFFFDNGDTYEGEVQNEKYNGYGIYTWEDGTVYEGQFLNNILNGEGKITFPEGSVFTGTFENGTYKSGQFKFDKIGIYEGAFQIGLRGNKGTFSWNSGDVYNGEWDDDAITGSGTLVFADGRKLDGIFENGKLIEGEYRINTKKGKYIIILSNGIISKVDINFSNGTKYTGEYKNNMFNGTGEITYPNGDTYSGGFDNGLKSGHGTYKWKDGSSYSGNWSNDMMNGNGIYYYAEGQDAYKLSGDFVDNKPDGTCYYYTDELTKYETDWKDGKCIKLTE